MPPMATAARSRTLSLFQNCKSSKMLSSPNYAHTVFHTFPISGRSISKSVSLSSKLPSSSSSTHSSSSKDCNCSSVRSSLNHDHHGFGDHGCNLGGNGAYSLIFRQRYPRESSFDQNNLCALSSRSAFSSSRHRMCTNLTPHSSLGESSLRFKGKEDDACELETCNLFDDSESFLTFTTFNILAPIYKRIGGNENLRESQKRESWLTRNEEILSVLKHSQSSVICLQEFWLDNSDLVKLYEEKLGEAGYQLYNVARTNNRGDGLLTAVKKKGLNVLDHREILFNDCGDRVAQILHLEWNHYNNNTKPIAEYKDFDDQDTLQLLVVNTHLLFPHNANSSLIRIRQVYKILEYLESYRRERNLPNMPIVLCGDWNGSKRGNVYKFLRSQGFISSYDMARHYSDNDCHQWVSHKNHHGNICGVDFIWLLNPKFQTQPLNADWKAAVFSMIKAKLNDIGLGQEKEAFDFFRTLDHERDHFTLKEFKFAIDKLGLTGEGTVGLTEWEINDLARSIDGDGNGVIDYEEFKSIFKITSMEETYAQIKKATGIEEQPWTYSTSFSPPKPLTLHDSPSSQGSPEGSAPAYHTSVALSESPNGHITASSLLSPSQTSSQHACLNFEVTEAFLYPPEAENGVWPDHWSLSDHATVTAIFVPTTSTS